MVAFELRHLLDTADTHSVARLGKLVNRRFQTARQHALEQPVLGRTSPRQAVDKAAPLPSKSHVLKAHSKAGYISGSDIVRMYQLKPTKYAVKPVIRDIIKGRYVQTLQPTGAHYVFFDSFADAAVFWSDVRSALFNGSYVSFTFVNFEDEMGQMFFPVLADTRIRKELVDWDALKQSMDHKMRALQESPHLSKLLTLLKQQPWLDTQQDRSLLEFLQQHPVERAANIWAISAGTAPRAVKKLVFNEIVSSLKTFTLKNTAPRQCRGWRKAFRVLSRLERATDRPPAWLHRRAPPSVWLPEKSAAAEFTIYRNISKYLDYSGN
ncbi:hypothetical protein KL941_004904 [Ogataea angusta]|nr:hypothetical protein KL941_004904 [Ogataea angusta]